MTPPASIHLGIEAIPLDWLVGRRVGLMDLPAAPSQAPPGASIRRALKAIEMVI